MKDGPMNRGQRPADRPTRMVDAIAPRRAAGIKLSSCGCSLQFQLVDATGEVFAIASLPCEQAIALLEAASTAVIRGLDPKDLTATAAGNC